MWQHGVTSTQLLENLLYHVLMTWNRPPSATWQRRHPERIQAVRAVYDVCSPSSPDDKRSRDCTARVRADHLYNLLTRKWRLNTHVCIRPQTVEDCKVERPTGQCQGLQLTRRHVSGHEIGCQFSDRHFPESFLYRWYVLDGTSSTVTSRPFPPKLPPARYTTSTIPVAF